MDKLKNHLKDNILIYLVLFTCAVIFSIICYVNYHPVEKYEPIDTQYFTIETIATALELFNSPEPAYLVLGVDSCQATRDYAEFLRFAVFDVKLKVHYLDLNSIDEEKDAEYLKKFVDKLDIEYNLFDKVDSFGKFIGNTPMTIIIKDRKQVYGYIGSMNSNSINAVAKVYGLI